MLCVFRLVAQAPLDHGFLFDLLLLFLDPLSADEADIGWRQVFKARVVALVVVVFDEGADLALVVSGQDVMLKHDTVLMVWCHRSILPWVCGW